MKIKNIIIPTGKILFLAFICGGFLIGNVLSVLTWSELEDFSIKLMEDEEFSKNLSPECVENVVGLGWKSANSTVINPNNDMYYFIFGDSTIEESGCNIMDLAENEPLKALYRHVPQWYINGDFIWKTIIIMFPILYTFLILAFWDVDKPNKYERTFVKKNTKTFRVKWLLIAILWVVVLVINEVNFM